VFNSMAYPVFTFDSVEENQMFKKLTQWHSDSSIFCEIPAYHIVEEME
jgi:hypothetical protein